MKVTNAAFLFFLSLSLTANTAKAQNQFGVKAGMTLSFNPTFDSWNSFSQDVTTVGKATFAGFAGGIYGRFHLDKALSIQPEIWYARQYNIVKNQGLVEGSDNAYWHSAQYAKMDYINIPFLLQYALIPGLRIEAGPQIAFPIFSPDAKSNVIDLKDSLRDVDFAVVAGLDYQLPTIGLGFFARYAHGITNLAKEGLGTARNKVCTFGVSYAASSLWL